MIFLLLFDRRTFEILVSLPCLELRSMQKWVCDLKYLNCGENVALHSGPCAVLHQTNPFIHSFIHLGHVYTGSPQNRSARYGCVYTGSEVKAVKRDSNITNIVFYFSWHCFDVQVLHLLWVLRVKIFLWVSYIANFTLRISALALLGVASSGHTRCDFSLLFLLIKNTHQVPTETKKKTSQFIHGTPYFQKQSESSDLTTENL